MVTEDANAGMSTRASLYNTAVVLVLESLTSVVLETLMGIIRINVRVENALGYVRTLT